MWCSKINPLANKTENMPVCFFVCFFLLWVLLFVCLFEFKIKLWGLSCLQYAFLACHVKRRGRRFRQNGPARFFRLFVCLFVCLLFLSVGDFFSEDLKKARRRACPASTVMKDSSKYQIRTNVWYMWYIFVHTEEEKEKKKNQTKAEFFIWRSFFFFFLFCNSSSLKC